MMLSLVRSIQISLLLLTTASAFVAPRPRCQARLSLRASSLVFEDIEVGEGEQVSKGDNISVHYVGKFDDGSAEGKVFEDSRKDKVNRGMAGALPGQPIIFPIGNGRVIDGWGT